MNKSFEVTFTAKSPIDFTGSYFRRKRFIPLIEVILTRYIPFRLEYPVKVTITGDTCTIKSINISNYTQNFSFTYPTWCSGWYSFDSIFAEELNSDHKTKKILHIYTYGVYYFGKVLLTEVIDIHANPFQNALIVLKDEQRDLAKHYRNCTELINQLCNFLKENSSFSFIDVVKTVLSTFSMHISNFDILNVEGVINIYHGRLVSAKSYFEDALVEVYCANNGCELICATKHSIIKKYPDGCIAFSSDLTDESERQAELNAALEKIEKTHEQTFLFPTS